MRIVSFIQNKMDGTALYRGTGVLNELRKIDKDIEIVEIGDDAFVNVAKGCDLAFFQRPDKVENIKFAQLCKSIKLPVVVDYDDNLLNVAPHNPYHQILSAHDCDYQSNVAQMLYLADLVTVSTEELKKQMTPYAKRIEVVRNAFDDYCFTMSKEFNYNKLVLWRGGKSHIQDLAIFKDEITKLVKENQDFTFVFFTDIFTIQRDKERIKWLTDLSLQYKNIIYKQPCDPYIYFYELKKMKPSLLLVPLEDTVFNHCKSDISFLEATYSGALAITPAWGEWVSGNYNSNEMFYNKATDYIKKIRDNDESLKVEWQRNKDYINEYRLLSIINKTRISLFRDIIK